MNQEKKLSIIVPVYNAEKYLEECVESLLNQTYSNIEIILVDDGSIDESGNICDRYANIHSNIKVIHQENQGVSAARNAALRIYSGDLVHFCDADDWMVEDAYEYCINLMEDANASICFFNAETFDKDGNVKLRSNKLPEGLLEKADAYHYATGIKKDNQVITFFLNVTSKIFTKELLVDKEGNQLFFNEDLKYLEDGRFLTDTYANWKRCVSTSRALYMIRLHEKSAMANVQEIDNLKKMFRGYEFIKESESIKEESLLKGYIDDAIFRASSFYLMFAVRDKNKTVYDYLIDKMSDNPEFLLKASSQAFNMFIRADNITEKNRQNIKNYLAKPVVVQNKPVGIVTLYGLINLGNRLQNYAVASYLGKLGFNSVSMITKQPKMSKAAVNAEKKAYLLYSKSPEIAQLKYPVAVRTFRFREFNNKYLKEKEYPSEKFTAKDAESYSYVVTGSDQVWNPSFRTSLGQMDNRLLSFVPAEKRVCFAPSIGMDDISDKYYPLFEKELDKYRVLTCREQSGADLIEKITGKKTEVVVDPTLMISREEWKSVSKTLPGFDYSQKYILYYFLGDKNTEIPENLKSYLDEKAESEGMGQYYVLDADDPLMKSVGPAEFIYLIEHAALVCTDSFHGTVFSIMLGTPFVICDRRLESFGQTIDMSSRLNTLLESLELDERLPANMKIDDDMWQVDYTRAREIIKEKQEFQKKLLMKQLNAKPFSMPYITLNNGTEIPAIGIGASIISPPPYIGVFDYELSKAQDNIYKYTADTYGKAVYDISSSYGQTIQVLGKTIKEYNDRDKFYVCLKISNREQEAGNIEEIVDKHMQTLGVDYVDMLMMHWPYPGKFVDTYKQMEELYKKGKAKALGLSNFTVDNIKELLNNVEIRPMLNQFEMHPLLTQDELYTFCIKNNIVPMSYTPLGRMHDVLMKNQLLNRLAAKYAKSVPQIILRWNVQKGVIPIPRTCSPMHLDEFMSVFNFNMTQEEMNCIDGLNENIRLRYNPETANMRNL